MVCLFMLSYRPPYKLLAFVESLFPALLSPPSGVLEPFNPLKETLRLVCFILEILIMAQGRCGVQIIDKIQTQSTWVSMRCLNTPKFLRNCLIPIHQKHSWTLLLCQTLSIEYFLIIDLSLFKALVLLKSDWRLKNFL